MAGAEDGGLGSCGSPRPGPSSQRLGGPFE